MKSPRPGQLRARNALRRALASATVAAALVLAPPADAANWLEQAQADLTCTNLADSAERESLRAPWLPDNAGGYIEYLTSAPRDQLHARFRYLLALGQISWWADHVNDQALRADILTAITQIADGFADGPKPSLFRQISNCAYAQMISTQIEANRTDYEDRISQMLSSRYSESSEGWPVGDWPLLLAMQDIALDPRARDANARLATRAVELAGSAIRANQYDRANRLLAAAARSAFVAGQVDDARLLMLRAMTYAGSPITPASAWRTIPVFYDVFEKLNGASDASHVGAMLTSTQPPAGFADRRAIFETNLRLSRAAQTQGRKEESGAAFERALLSLNTMTELDRPSVAFYRHAVEALKSGTSFDSAAAWNCDPKHATERMRGLRSHYESLVKTTQQYFLPAARFRIVFDDNAELSSACWANLASLPSNAQSEFQDYAFRLAQLRSFGRLTLATVSAELSRAAIDPEWRESVENFFRISTQLPLLLRKAFHELVPKERGKLPATGTIGDTFQFLEFLSQKSGSQFPEFVAMVKQRAPAVADLITPHPSPIRDFQSRLRAGEAIVSTLVTAKTLYVWAITAEKVQLSRQEVGEAELFEKVRRLRASLQPAVIGNVVSLAPFDARDAYDLYKSIFAPVEGTLRGVSTVLYYGHGPLGSIPPAVLVAEPPSHDTIRSADELRATKFLVDRFSFTVLPDLSLFVSQRDRARQRQLDQKFLGVGAPLVAQADLDAIPRSQSYELAGGLDGKELADLPKLPESIDEIRAMGAIAGIGNSTLWLGPDASETSFDGNKLSSYRTIVLATHGFLPNEIRNVAEPALLLALPAKATGRFDGILTSHEIANLQLDADLVILSACNTASADGQPHAEAFTGLTQSFFTAGARTLMVSHWPVMSGAAAQLSVGTFERWNKQGIALSRSLQQAMVALRSGGAASAVEQHPSFWGPFVVVGAGEAPGDAR